MVEEYAKEGEWSGWKIVLGEAVPKAREWLGGSILGWQLVGRQIFETKIS